MVMVHVIIDPGNNRIIFYSYKKKKVVNSSSIKCFPLESIDKIFKNIKAVFDTDLKNDDTFGWAFICLDDCIDSRIRNKFLECSKIYGFTNFKILDKATILFIKTIYDSFETFNHKSVIWVFDGFKSYIWTKKHQTFTLISKYEKEVDEEILTNLKKYFSDTKIYLYYCSFHVENAICKFLSSEQYSINLNVRPKIDLETFFKININDRIGDCSIQKMLIHRKIIIKVNSQTIYISGKYLNLPHCQLLNLECDHLNESVVELIEHDKVIQKQALKFYNAINLNIDVNGICSFVPFNSIEMEQKKEVQNFSSETNAIPSVSNQLNRASRKKSSIFSIFKRVEPIYPSLESIKEMNSSLLNSEPTFIPADPQPLLIQTSYTTYSIPPKIAEFNRDINAVGIDLGTSRCCVAVSKAHSFETVGIENNGDRLMPSYISFLNPNQPVCGQIVVDQLRYASKSTIFDSKRLIGKEFEYIDSDPAWPFELINVKGMAGLLIESREGPLLTTPTEVSAVLLKHIKKEVEKFQGQMLSKAVITIPAAFTKSQKQETIKAAKMAEWSLRLLPEPVAAAFAYFNNHKYDPNSTMLVFDLGGGTLDICLFKVINNQIIIIKQSGDNFLGGRDFDNLLFNYFYDRLEHEFGIVVRNDEKKKYKLLAECQKIKHSLSVMNEGRLDVDEFSPDNGNTILITRKMFEEKAKPLLFKIRTFITTILKESGYQSSQISKILLVGGGCRMPMITELLASKFPEAKQCRDEQPEEVVAVGAAMYAYYLMTK